MSAHGALRRLTHWIAALAVLFAALAPTVSHALRASYGDVGFEVCTAPGPRGGDGPTSALALDHCPYCTFSTQSPALPPAAPLAIATPALADGPAAATAAAPPAPQAWRWAPSRAPPAHA